MFFYPASAIRHPENNTSTPLLARVSERVQLFSRLLTRSLLYKKLNCIHRNPVIEMIVEKEEDDHFSSVRNNADPDSLIEITRESKLLITY